MYKFTRRTRYLVFLRITCRISQLGALIKTKNVIPKTDEVEEAIQDLTNFLENGAENVQLKRLISVYRLKTLLLMNAKGELLWKSLFLCFFSFFCKIELNDFCSINYFSNSPCMYVVPVVPQFYF